jgi:eukaryotic-like serine/threonine-protein kinase
LLGEDTEISPSTRANRIGPYALLLRLAKGGMAQVFIALRDGAAEICVLKRLLAEIELLDVAVRRFYREAHVASSLDHPNVARVIDADFDDRSLYIAMEYIAGLTVAQLLEAMIARKQRLSVEQTLAIVLSILDGLAYAHEAKSAEGSPLGLVHRDLSPRNVMVGYRGEVKIIDFGVARAEVDDFKTQPGMLIGTLQYFSPEQAAAAEVDHRSDLYAVAVIAYELLSGTFVIDSPSPWEMLILIQKAEPRPLDEVNRAVPPALARAIHRGLSKSREGRWQSAREMKRALEEAAGPLRRPRDAILGELMASVFPSAEVRTAQVIGEARARVDELARSLGRSNVPLDIIGAKTRTAIAPTEPTESAELSVTDRRDLKRHVETEFEPTAVPEEMPPSERTRLSRTFILDPRVAAHDTLVAERLRTIGSGSPASAARPAGRSLLTPPMLVAVALAGIAAALVIEAGSNGDREAIVATTVEPKPIAVANHDPRASARESAPAEEPSTDPDPPQREIARTRTSARRASRSSEPSASANTDDPGRAALRRKLAQLRASSDGDLFKEVYDLISARARTLDPEARRRIQVDVDAALRIGSPEALAAAGEKLLAIEPR